MGRQRLKCRREFVSVLGPFPNQGEYEHCYTFEGLKPVCPVTDALVETLLRVYERGGLKTAQNISEPIEINRKQRRREAAADPDDVWNDSKPAVHAEMPDHIERFTVLM